MKNILIIRRDNIGDLVCTTPLIEGIKKAYPSANIHLLINSVSQDVVKNNPFIYRTYVYKKAKHRAKNQTALGVYLQRAAIFLKLRTIRFDIAILANPEPCNYSLRMARLAGVKNIAGADLNNNKITHPYFAESFSGKHQVEKTFSYLKSITQDNISIPEVKVFPGTDEIAFAQQKCASLLPECDPIYGVHISSRSPKRRWSLENYAEIIQRLTAGNNCGVLIFWSPQGTLSPDDIGDQARAEQLIALCGNKRVALYPTGSVRELIGGFAQCQTILCSDGGQMHLASALQKKLVVFFGDTNKEAWHPWSGKYIIMQTPSGECDDVSVDEVWQSLQEI